MIEAKTKYGLRVKAVQKRPPNIAFREIHPAAQYNWFLISN